VLPNKKKILFPSSFWGIFDFFVFFNNFGKRIKECYVTKEESSVANILVPSTWNTGMLRAKGHMQEKDTRKNPPGAKGVKTQRQSATGLAYKACFRWFS
jgi:hypothetical protein